jgi:hypothetical protein
MFGPSMPILYPVVMLAMLSTYLTDRLAICWFYREPPHYDDAVTRAVLRYIKLMVILSLPFTYWQLGNRSIFDSGHTLK